MASKTHTTREIDLTREDNLPAAFTQALAGAVPGTRLLYHRGPFIGGTRLARLAMSAHQAGQVELVQRRVVKGRVNQFEYIAVKRHNRKSPQKR